MTRVFLPRPEPHTQKKTLRAAEADEQERELFADLVAERPHGRFLCVEETGMNTDLARTHARAPRGERTVDYSAPRNKPTRTGPIGAMGAEGIPQNADFVLKSRSACLSVGSGSLRGKAPD